jgi:hypothetical protein
MKADTGGGTSNDIAWFFVTKQPRSDEATGSGAIRARGDESSNNLSANDQDSTAEGEIFIGTTTAAANADIDGKKNVSVLAKITSITNANPDPNGTAVPTGITPVGQFKIAAAAHTNSNNGDNDAVLSGVIFTVNATNVAIGPDSFDFYNKADSTVQHDCTAYNSSNGVAVASTSVASGVLLVDCRGLIAGTVDTDIDQGTDSTFVLEANVTNAQVNSTASSTLQVSLTDFDSISRTIFGVTSGQSHLQWRDTDGSGSATFNWVEYPETTVKSTSYQS